MTIERYVEQIPADVTGALQLPLERGPGNFLLFQSSLANVTITLMFDGVREVFANVNGGIYVRRIRPWQNLRIDGAIGTQCTFFIGSVEGIDTDETDIRQQVAILAGVSATADQPATAVTELPNVAAPNAAGTAIFVPNFLRRRIGFSLLSNAAWVAGTVFFRKTAAGANLFEVQPGVIYNMVGFYGGFLRNDSGGALTVMLVEET